MVTGQLVSILLFCLFVYLGTLKIPPESENSLLL